MFGTGFRVALPVVGAAAVALVGSGLDLVSSTLRNLNNRPTKAAEDHPNRITPEVVEGRPCIRGIPIRDILDHLTAGSSRKQILRIYPGLEDVDVSAALEFVSGAMIAQATSVLDPLGETASAAVRQVPVSDIIKCLAMGSSRKKILRTYPGLEDADISAALRFASGVMNLRMPIY